MFQRNSVSNYHNVMTILVFKQKSHTLQRKSLNMPSSSNEDV